jgi:hypothetical protein
MPVLAYDFPLFSAFVSMLFFFLWVLWLILLFRTIGDIFRADDLSGAGKALWLLLVIITPYLGVFVYLIARGDGMGQRDLARVQAQEAGFRDYVQSVAGSGGGGSVSTELERLAALKDKGVISDAEFAQQKAKLLA